jgi:hypothetical protein
MAQRTDERTPTKDELKAYECALELAAFTWSASKPKRKRDKKGNEHDSNKHVPMRYSELGKELVKLSTDIGALVLEANVGYYVGKNLNQTDRGKNYIKRIELEQDAYALTFRMEHIVRLLHERRPFADSTFTHWLVLICTVRGKIKAWRDSEKRELKGCGL